MLDWEDYVDESYDASTFCVGGFLATKATWENIEPRWTATLDRENCQSAKGGFPPISRYHATDVSNLKNEFSASNGWTVARQIRFVKRLLKITRSARNVPSGRDIMGIVHGGTLTDFKKHFRDSVARKGLYRVALTMHLAIVGKIIHEHFPGDRVTVYYDRTKEFGSVADEVFRAIKNNPDPDCQRLSCCFVTMAPLGWEDAIPLQPADLMAYEGFKRIKEHADGNDKMRKSLEAMIGGSIPIEIGRFSEEDFGAIALAAQNILDGNPVGNGVKAMVTHTL